MEFYPIAKFLLFCAGFFTFDTCKDFYSEENTFYGLLQLTFKKHDRKLPQLTIFCKYNLKF